MDSAPMLGVALVVIMVFFARRFGWNDADARPWFLGAVAGFALAIFCTPMAVAAGEVGWVGAAGAFSGLAVILLFWGMTRLTRLDARSPSTNEERPATPEE